MMVLLRLTEERPDAAIQAALSEVVRQAKTEWSPSTWEGEFPQKGFGITALAPKHVYGGSTSPSSSVTWGASVTAASAWNTWFDITITNQAYLVPVGLFDLDGAPEITAIQPSANGIDLPICNIEEMHGFDIARAFFTRPFAVRPNNQLKTQVTGRTATTDERMGLLGHTIGKRAYLIAQ